MGTVGRPTTYTAEIGAQICEATATSNMGLVNVCRELNLSYWTVLQWQRNNREFAEMYEKAKQSQADHLAEEIIEIADTPSRDLIDAQDRKLRVDARKWVAAKLKPKMYGERNHVDIDVKQTLQVSADQFAALLTAAKEAPKQIEAEDAEFEELPPAAIGSPEAPPDNEEPDWL